MANGTIFEDSSKTPKDMKKLIDILSSISNKVSTDADNKSKGGAISSTPNPNDIKSYVGNLGLTVPAGFLMIHNDLEKLAGGLTAGGGGASSKVTAVSSAISAATDLIDHLTSPAGFADILNNEEVNTRLAAEPDVYNIRLQGTLAYLKGYYNNLLENFGVKVDYATGEITQGITIAGVFNDVGQGIGAMFGNIIEGTMQGVDNVINKFDIEGDPDVKAIRKSGYITYLKAYYNNLLSQFGIHIDYVTGEATEQTSFNSIFSDLGSGIGNAFGKMVEGSLGGLQNAIANTQFENDEEVKNIRRLGFITYLKGYYNNLISQFGITLDYENNIVSKKEKEVGDEVANWGSTIGTAIGNSFGNATDSLSKSITTFVGEASLNSDEEVKAVRKLGYIAYLKGYYSNLIGEFGFELNVDTMKMSKKDKDGWDKFKSAFGDVGAAIGNLFGGITTSLGRGLSNTISDGVLNTDEDVKKVRKLGYIAYLKGYYNNLVGEFGYEIDFDKGVSSMKDKSLWDKFKSAASDIGAAIGNLFSGVTDKMGNSLITFVSEASLETDDDIKQIRKDGLSIYLTQYYARMAEAISNVDTKKNSDVEKAARDALKHSFDEISNATSAISLSFNDKDIINAIGNLTNKVGLILKNTDDLLVKQPIVMNSQSSGPVANADLNAV